MSWFQKTDKKVSSAESAQGYAIIEIEVGGARVMRVQSLGARNKTTVSKLWTLGYKTPGGDYVAIKSAAQAADVDAYVSADFQPEVMLAGVYGRIEAPALNDVLVLEFGGGGGGGGAPETAPPAPAQTPGGPGGGRQAVPV